MRLIDGDALLNAYDIEAIKQHQDNRYVRGCLDIIGDIEDALTIDAVPVVRCKDCKYLNAEYRCVNWRGLFDYTKADDFCSYGERKE